MIKLFDTTRKEFQVRWGMFWCIPMVIGAALIIGSLPLLIPCIIVSVTGAQIWEAVS